MTMTEIKCTDCKNCVITQQRHNGDDDEIKTYTYCKIICIDEFDMSNIIGCDQYEKQ